MLVAVQELHWKNKNTSNAAQCDNHRAIARNDARHGPSPLLVSTPPSAEIADAALLLDMAASGITSGHGTQAVRAYLGEKPSRHRRIRSRDRHGCRCQADGPAPFALDPLWSRLVELQLICVEVLTSIARYDGCPRKPA